MARLTALLLLARSVAARDCYATIVYGSEPKHVCTAAVLGRALRWLDPWKSPRAAGKVHRATVSPTAAIGTAEISAPAHAPTFKT